MASFSGGKDRLDPSEYLKHAPSIRGEQVHVNHEGCPAGTDTKRRLYVKRTEDDSVVAYCHHCGRNGVSRVRSPVVGYGDRRAVRAPWHDGAGLRSSVRPTGSHGNYGSRSSSVFIPRCAVSDPTQWPAAGRVWAARFGLDPEHLCKKGWAYLPDQHRILIPCFDAVEGGLLGYQTRRLDDRDGTPKYLTRTDKSKTQRLYYEVCPRKTGVCVLVEDALSCEKVGQFADCIAILTTTMDTALRNRLVTQYSEVVVWLDDDNTDVRGKQLELKKMLDPYVKVRVIKTGKDPKRHSTDEIRTILGSRVA